MRTIISTNGLPILVDDEDFERLSAVTWWVRKDGYVSRTVMVDGVKTSLKIHRMVLNLQAGVPFLVDHINGNRADNRKANLRVCTHAQNAWNMGKAATNTTGYKGVSMMANGRFVAQIRCHGRKYHLGCFGTPEEAHEVYCLAADMLHGEFSNYGRKEVVNG
ncbi:TPA: HNH endonuclease [Burkholderia cenocepacia]|nr:HNH endonuclease [Burkholderia cenocepacia]